MSNKKQLILFSSILILITGEYFFHTKLAQILQVKVKKELIRKKIKISFSKIDYGYLPPRISLDNVTYKDSFTTLVAANISLSTKIIPLLKGRVEPDKLTIKKASSSIQVDLTKEISKKNIDLDNIKLPNILKLIPIEQLNIKDSKVIILSKDDVLNLNIKHVSLKKLYNKLQVEIRSSVVIKSTHIKDKFHLNTKLRWQETGFFINFFTLQKKNSILQLSGSLKKQFINNFDLKTKNIYSDINELRAQINLDLSEFNSVLKYFLKNHIPSKTHIKDFSGRVQASVYYYDSEQTSDKSILNLQANNLRTPLVSVKSIAAKGELRDNEFSTNSIKINFSEKSTLEINDFKIKKENESLFISYDLKSSFLRIEDALSSLNLKINNLSAPVYLNTHCGGLLSKQILVKCKGSGDLIQLDILNPTDSQKIFSVNKISANFTSSITKTDFNFNTDLTYKNPKSNLNSTGRASGNVNYITGFDIDFETSPIDLSLVNEIAGQKFSGLSSLKGNSKGSSLWGEVTTTVTNKNFKFNDLSVGNNTSLLKYKFPLLSLQNIKGSVLTASNFYSGSILLNVDKNDLIIDIQAKNTNDSGFRTFFENSFSFPKEIKFDSDFSIHAQNGLDINKMDLELQSSLKNLDLFGEHFSSGTLSLNGAKGKWNIVNALLNKEKSSFSAKGFFLGLKEIHTDVVSKNFTLESSDFLNALGIKLSGPAKITLKTTGSLDGPKATGKIFLTDTQGSRKNSLGDSDVSYRLFENTISFEGEAFNKSLIGKGEYPLSKIGDFSYNGEIKKLNLLDFFNLNTENTLDSKILLSFKANFSIKNISNNINPTGSIENTKLEFISNTQNSTSVIQKENTSLSKLIDFDFNQTDHNATLSIDLSQKHRKRLLFNGNLSLNFLKPFIPTCELITGEFLSKNLKFTSSPKGISTSGTASITNTSFKTNSFPYSFNNIKTNISFKKNLITFDKIKASLADSHLKGHGFIRFNLSGPDINFNLNYTDLILEFPSKILTRSNGQLNLSGTKLPLVLKGKLFIKDGLFSKDILSPVNSKVITPHRFLPEDILRKSSPPAILNVNIYIKNKIKIKNNEVDGFANGFLKTTGNPMDPIMNGRIHLKKDLKIYFHDKEFILNEGYLSYKNNLVTNPNIFIDALAKIKDNNDLLEKSYTVRMLIKGAADTPSIKFSSQPFLGENEIISLLTIGTISTQSLGQEIATTEQATYSGLQFGFYLLQKNQALKDLQKQTGTQIGLSSSINSGGVNPTVFVKKSWTPKITSTFSQTFGNQKNISFITDYKLNKKTSTVLSIQNNQAEDASQLINRRVQQGVIFDLGLQYKFEFN